jgi:hypothetical protein
MHRQKLLQGSLSQVSGQKGGRCVCPCTAVIFQIPNNLNSRLTCAAAATAAPDF